jgi:hypothetical protein
MFLPGAAKYGDLPVLLALSAPTRLCVTGETEAALSSVRTAYKATGKTGNLTVLKDGLGSDNDLVKWICED